MNHHAQSQFISSLNEQAIAHAIDSFGRIAVLAGGDSREREISLDSGSAVFEVLKNLGFNVELIDTKNLDLASLVNIDHAFIALHGMGGEDGRIQALLEFLHIPYTGSGVSASAIAMDKVLSKKIWQAAHLPLAESYVAKNLQEAHSFSEAIGFPVIFKPSLEGSSVGITKVNSSEEIPEAFVQANLAKQKVLIEKFIVGEEFSVGIVGETVLPSVRLVTQREFYDFTAKYIDDDTEYFCPSGLSEEEERHLAGIAKKAFVELGCSGWGRVDFIRDQKGAFYLLEANTSPGLTSHSLVPKAAKQLSYSFEALIIEVLTQSCAH